MLKKLKNVQNQELLHNYGQKVVSGALKVALQHPRLSTSPWLPTALLWASEPSGNTQQFRVGATTEFKV